MLVNNNLLWLSRQVDSAYYPPLLSVGRQRAVMLCGWEDNRRPGGK